MADLKILSILIVVLSIACALGKPAEENPNDASLNEVNSSNEQLQPKDQLLIYVFNNLKEMSLDFVNRAENISQLILKDDTLLAHSSSAEIQGFKKNLTDFLEKYNKYREPEEIFDIADLYANATDFYFELPKEGITPDTTLIIATLKKFEADKLEKKVEKLFNDFVEKFKNQFEEAKPLLKEETAMLEWFANFKTITITEDKVAAIEKFLEFY